MKEENEEKKENTEKTENKNEENETKLDDQEEKAKISEIIKQEEINENVTMLEEKIIEQGDKIVEVGQ